MNYYNENDRKKAEWLRQLIAHNVISKGEVDERSIKEVSAADLVGYQQCHFFAGIGIWSYALRLAGVPDDHPLWTGSCPCKPFSVAGQGKGTSDERHLWPAWFRLISQCRPGLVFGEQVADGDGITWLDNVHTQMESIHYRIGALVLPASSVGAPHGRHRTFFVADTSLERSRPMAGGPDGQTLSHSGRRDADVGVAQSEQLRCDSGTSPSRREAGSGQRNDASIQRPDGWRSIQEMPPGGHQQESQRLLDSGGVANAQCSEQRQDIQHEQLPTGRIQTAGRLGSSVNTGELWNSSGCVEGTLERESETGDTPKEQHRGPSPSLCLDDAQRTRLEGLPGHGHLSDEPRRKRTGSQRPTPPPSSPGPCNGFWSNAEWIPTRGKLPGTVVWRPIKPNPLPLDDGPAPNLLPLCDYGFPLVKNAQARTLRLKGYGDGIVAQVAAHFIRAYFDIQSAPA